jgi:hypothetical protein
MLGGMGVGRPNAPLRVVAWIVAIALLGFAVMCLLGKLAETLSRPFY